MTTKQFIKYTIYGAVIGLMAWALSATFRGCQTQYTEPEIEHQ